MIDTLEAYLNLKGGYQFAGTRSSRALETLLLWASTALTPERTINTNAIEEGGRLFFVVGLFESNGTDEHGRYGLRHLIGCEVNALPWNEFDLKARGKFFAEATSTLRTALIALVEMRTSGILNSDSATKYLSTVKLLPPPPLSPPVNKSVWSTADRAEARRGRNVILLGLLLNLVLLAWVAFEVTQIQTQPPHNRSAKSAAQALEYHLPYRPGVQKH